MTPPRPHAYSHRGVVGGQQADADQQRGQLWSDVGMGWAMAAELLTATMTWGGIGWLADRWLHTAPWLMSIGFVAGNFAGIYLCWLRTTQQEAAREKSAAVQTTRDGRSSTRPSRGEQRRADS